MGYYLALQAGSYEELVGIATPLFYPSNTTSIHQAAAGDYYGVEDIIEYLTLVIPSLNQGYVWFSPSHIVEGSIRYFPDNATIFVQQTHKTTFDCYKLPPADLSNTGECRSPLVDGISGGMFTFKSCSAQVVQYISNFDDYTNRGAVRAGSAWDTCWKAMAFCKGENEIFDGDFEKCVAFMNQIPVVACETAVLRGNSSTCRGLHSFLAEHRPDLHCQHIAADSKPCVDDHCGGDLVCQGDYPPGHWKWSAVVSDRCPPAINDRVPVPDGFCNCSGDDDAISGAVAALPTFLLASMIAVLLAVM
jgi:hypothetical protein